MNRRLKLIAVVVGTLAGKAMLCVSTSAALIAYEGFDFAGPTIDTKGSGFGFSGNWINVNAPFLNVSSDGVSLDSPAFPFDPVGNRIDSTAAKPADFWRAHMTCRRTSHRFT